MERVDILKGLPGSQSMTCWSASISSGRGWTCRRSVWWRSSTQTRKDFCVRDISDSTRRPRRPQYRRAGHHVADRITRSMQAAIDETQRPGPSRRIQHDARDTAAIGHQTDIPESVRDHRHREEARGRGIQSQGRGLLRKRPGADHAQYGEEDDRGGERLDFEEAIQYRNRIKKMKELK